MKMWFYVPTAVAYRSGNIFKITWNLSDLIYQFYDMIKLFDFILSGEKYE